MWQFHRGHPLFYYFRLAQATQGRFPLPVLGGLSTFSSDYQQRHMTGCDIQNITRGYRFILKGIYLRVNRGICFKEVHLGVAYTRMLVVVHGLRPDDRSVDTEVSVWMAVRRSATGRQQALG